MISETTLKNSFRVSEGSTLDIANQNYVYVIESGKKVPIVQKRAAASYNYTIKYKLKPEVSITSQDAVSVINTILSLSVSDHKNIKLNTNWQNLYQRRKRNVSFMDANGTVADLVNTLWTYPCHYCGIVLPEELIQVDHQMPQASPTYAVLKVFHSVTLPDGSLLTTGAATGQKNKQIGIFLGNAMGPVAPVGVKARAFGSTWNLKAGSLARDARYTLNDKGRLILSLMEAHFGLPTLSQHCLNSLLNLVPSCSNCNVKKSDNVHVY